MTKLIDKPVVKGDIVEVQGAIVQKDDQDNPMNVIMNMMRGPKKRPTLGTIRLVVEKTTPASLIL